MLERCGQFLKNYLSLSFLNLAHYITHTHNLLISTIVVLVGWERWLRSMLNTVPPLCVRGGGENGVGWMDFITLKPCTVLVCLRRS